MLRAIETTLRQLDLPAYVYHSLLNILHNLVFLHTTVHIIITKAISILHTRFN